MANQLQTTPEIAVCTWQSNRFSKRVGFKSNTYMPNLFWTNSNNNLTAIVTNVFINHLSNNHIDIQNKRLILLPFRMLFEVSSLYRVLIQKTTTQQIRKHQQI